VVKTAISDGADFADLGRALCYAAALRLARFGTANEHGDWETAHHVFTYCNAVHQGLKRIGGFDEVALPNLTVTEPNPAARLDYWRFQSQQVAE
jgi:hypothetical protein